MKILVISSYGGLGGGELSLATFLEHRPAHVDAEVLLVSDGPLRELLGEHGVPASAATGYAGRPGPRDLGRFTRGLLAKLARSRPDVVWAVGLKGALLSVPACRVRGVPLVWHKVDFSWDRPLALPLAAAVTGVITVSEAAAEAIGPLRSARHLGVVPPPLRLGEDVIARADPGRPTIGTLARLVPYKGHHHIIEAAALLVDRFPALRVVLAGGPVPEYPDYPASLEALVDELGLDGRVELLGHTDDVASVLERLTVFVTATYRDAEGYGLEGLSGAMLEASWAGVPVVAVGGGGTAEGVIDGVTGTIVEAADPRLLAAAIARYLEDPDLARRTAAAARTFAHERFAAGPAAQRLFALLAEAAA